MHGRLLDWEPISKREAIELQSFTCTDDWPRTPGGRRLPTHPRQWEWEAQRHLRNLSQLLRDGDAALVGRDEERRIGAAVHLSYDKSGDLVVATIKAGAVSTRYRRLGDRFVGDEVLEVAKEEARARALQVGASQLLLEGYIHRENRASMRMAERAGLEPQGLPTSAYQAWIREISL